MKSELDGFSTGISTGRLICRKLHGILYAIGWEHAIPASILLVLDLARRKYKRNLLGLLMLYTLVD